MNSTMFNCTTSRLIWKLFFELDSCGSGITYNHGESVNGAKKFENHCATSFCSTDLFSQGYFMLSSVPKRGPFGVIRAGFLHTRWPP